ncbi:hypothetical protein [Streptomyces chilikensis]|uniref:Uncharacterized protein n=1 Tax=Streptomyces chilikensis TaxID=1194079 RepID=A0ABV3EJC1_9ACTN
MTQQFPPPLAADDAETSACEPKLPALLRTIKEMAAAMGMPEDLQEIAVATAVKSGQDIVSAVLEGAGAGVHHVIVAGGIRHARERVRTTELGLTDLTNRRALRLWAQLGLGQVTGEPMALILRTEGEEADAVRAWMMPRAGVVRASSASETFSAYCRYPDGEPMAPPAGTEYQDAYALDL